MNRREMDLVISEMFNFVRDLLENSSYSDTYWYRFSKYPIVQFMETKSSKVAGIAKNGKFRTERAFPSTLIIMISMGLKE